MKRMRDAPIAVLVTGLLAAACTGGGPAAPTGVPGTPPTTLSTAAPTAPPPGSPGASSTQPAGTSSLPAGRTSAPTTASEAWQAAALVDVRSGETLRVADLAGKLVVIEPMAIWCTSCRAQQNELRSALDAIGRPADIVAVSLDVDPFEEASELAAYADEREYPWHFAVAGPDLSRLLAQRFGDQVLSPPSTPKIVIAPDGTADVSFGFQSADELVSHFNELLP